MAVSVALATLGCKVNQAEAEELRQRLEARGCLVTGLTQAAQVYVVNTCTVTHVADRKSRNLVLRACRANPKAPVLVAGCYARRAPQELISLPQVRIVHRGDTEELARYLDELALDPSPLTLNPEPSAPRRSRTLVKVQDGCDQHCTYCVVPLARGRSRSLPLAEVVRRVEESVAAGRREVVLTGVDLTDYGQEWGGSLAQLLDGILEAGPERLRLSSLQPQAVTEDLLGRWRDKRLCRHFHLALQSGSEAVLRRMGRRYNVAQYAAAVERIRRAVPEAAITTDVMVGFPGESQAEFEESYSFCRSLAFARMHVFQYSERPGTAACRLSGAVSARTKAARSQAMQALAAEASEARRRGFLGRTMEVLFMEEVKGRPGCWRGLTDNYLEVEVESGELLADRLLPVKLQALGTGAMEGSIVSGASGSD